MTARSVGAVVGARFAAMASRRLGRGGGTSLPGLVATWIEPHVIHRVAAQLGHGCVVVTGTNGKTTTTRMLADITRAAGLSVVHNRSGSNLMRGLAATAVGATDLRGRIGHADRTLGVFEVDEATLPLSLQELRPRAVIFTNLFRDQLDRYGEVDSIIALWARAIDMLDREATLVLNADDPSVANLSGAWGGSSLFFGVDDPRQATVSEHAADSRWCAACGAEYEYEALYYGHIGVWKCPGCGRARRSPGVSARRVQLRPDGPTLLEADTPGGPLAAEIRLGGLYNAYNALAATAGALAIGLSLSAVREGLADFDAAFGRQESLELRGRRVQVLLCKNPTGVNQVLRLLAADPRQKCLLIVLNDGIADGRDVSWIWDVDFELLAGQTQRIVVSGRRAADMALRLKYAGLARDLLVDGDQHAAVEIALSATPEGGCLYVLPTYTAMLTVRERLAHLAGRSHFWEN